MDTREEADGVVPGAPVAVIDIGSNSSRVLVAEVPAGGALRVVAEAKAALRLVREVDRTHVLSPDAIDRVVLALRDFTAIAWRYGASEPTVIATAAVREAANRADLVAAVRADLGLDVAVIDGDTEARYAFLGALHALPVEHGMLLDVGGGSLQLAHFRDRVLRATWSFPLGALRLAGRCFADDPPTSGQVRTLKRLVDGELRAAGVPALAPDELLVATGGTVRNLAKVDRARHSYPLSQLGGYELGLRGVTALCDVLLKRSVAARGALPGLNPERADAIAAGAVVVRTVMAALRAERVVVAGHGLREGVALASGGSESIPAVSKLRGRTLIAPVTSLTAEEAAAGARRQALIVLLAGQAPLAITDELRAAILDAALALESGRAFAFFQRHRHAEGLLRATELPGYTHRELALRCAVLRAAGSERFDPASYRPLVVARDRAEVERAAVLLATADAAEQRMLPTVGVADCRVGVTPDEVIVAIPGAAAVQELPLRQRFRRAFGLALQFSEDERDRAPDAAAQGRPAAARG
jgi:exopolyphosphatase/guanosine-5'-triphosphate,3'-diphosphate pyrophosphatase